MANGLPKANIYLQVKGLTYTSKRTTLIRFRLGTQANGRSYSMNRPQLMNRAAKELGFFMKKKNLKNTVADGRLRMRILISCNIQLLNLATP